MWQDDFEENMDDLAALEEEIMRENADREDEDCIMETMEEVVATKPIEKSKVVDEHATKYVADLNRPSLKPASKTAAELARSMQAARVAAVGQQVSGFDRGHSSLFANCGALMQNNRRLKTIPFADSARFLSLTPIDSNVYNDTIILYCGRRYFLRERKPFILQVKSDSFNPAMKNLLSKSFRDLQYEVDDEIKTKSALFQTQLQRSSHNAEKENNDDVSVAAPQLWVDKYSPRSFTQLMSVEKTNREVLKAIKRWDHYVFKLPVVDPPVNTTASNGNNNNNMTQALPLYTDDGRPRQKVIMLCGPPGTGKTTLAHVAARHCGYRTVEINASDDRSPEALRELLSRATQSTTLDADKRPNCIIFDEADGIADTAKHSLDILLDVIKAPLSAGSSNANKNKKKGNKDKAKEGGNGGSNAPFALTRPLIIICNDQYAPVLRELKQLAEVFVFQAPSEMRLVQRLKHICALEGIHIRNASLLSELIHVTGHDIRSTINNLQFAAMRLKQQDHHVQDVAEVDLGDVVTSMMNMGLKDDNLDSFQVWQRIFTSHTTTTASTKSNGAVKEKKSEMMTAIDSMQHHGDYDHLINGMHENLHQTATDHSTTTGGEILSRFAYSADWLSMSDVMMTSTRNLSDGFQLMPHVALTAGAVHMSHAITISGGIQPGGGGSSGHAFGGNNNNGVKLQWPKKDREAYFARLQRMNVLQSLQEQQAQHQHRSPENKENIAMDYASALLDVFVPKVRPLPMLSLSPQEREVVLEVAQRMESCGVSYIPMAVVDRSDGAGKYQHRGNKPFAAQNKTKNPTAINTESIFLQDRVEFHLEPSLELLVAFDQLKCDELAGRHVAIPQEVRAVIYKEQRQLSISQKEVKVASEATESTPSASATVAMVTPDNMVMIVDENESRLSAPKEVSMLSKRAQVTGMNGRTFDEDPDAAGKGHGGLLSTFLVKRGSGAESDKPATKKAKIVSTAKVGSFVGSYQREQQEKKQAAYLGFNKGFNSSTMGKQS